MTSPKPWTKLCQPQAMHTTKLTCCKVNKCIGHESTIQNMCKLESQPHAGQHKNKHVAWRENSLIHNVPDNAQRTRQSPSLLQPNTHPLQAQRRSREVHNRQQRATQHVRRMWCNKDIIVRPCSKADVVSRVPNDAQRRYRPRPSTPLNTHVLKAHGIKSISPQTTTKSNVICQPHVVQPKSNHDAVEQATM